MSLRSRLWLVLGGLFVLPLVVGGLVLAFVVPGARTDQAQTVARSGAAAVAAALTERCAGLGLAARNVALESAVTDPEAAVAATVKGGGADYAAVMADDGSVLAAAGRLSGGAADPARLRSCAAGDVGARPALAERVPISGEIPAAPQAAEAVVAVDLRSLTVSSLGGLAGPDAALVLLRERQVVASTAEPDTARTLAGAAPARGQARVGDWTLWAEPAGSLPYMVVVAAPLGDSGLRTTPLLLIVVAAALIAGLLVTSVARSLSRPFAELTEAAERVAHGDLETRVEADTEGEAGRLGSALNLMTDELRRNLAELERNRQELRESLERIGDALSATHDLDGLLQVVLETAVGTLGSRAGVVVFRQGDQIQVAAEVGLHDAGLPAPTDVRPGEGVLGRVLATGAPARGELGSGPVELTPAETEPSSGQVLAVPLRSMGAVAGVLALYERDDDRPFEPGDQEALATLAGQASIAIDNVHLHQEAQRLSTTDPLTGVWNFRYLSMSLAREIERSTRFHRPLAVLMLDLDHFKQVNDVHGHARGDSVLRELAERVLEQIREVDTFARYGGEEFVVLLPETTVEGAAQLADRICVAVRREPFRAEGEQPLDITVSIGGAAFPGHGSSPATLMRAADKALYVAKGQGRDRWHIPGHPGG